MDESNRSHMSLNSFTLRFEEWYMGKNRVLIHVLFWIAIYLLGAVQTNFTVERGTSLFFIMTFREVFTIMIVHYFIAYHAIPRFFIKSKWVFFVGSLVLSYIFMGASLYYTLYFLKIYKVSASVHIPFLDFFMAKGFLQTLVDPLRAYNLLLFQNIVFFSLLIKITKDFFSSRNRALNLETENIKLEKEKADMELNFLKSQIHPHFFFNTLNNIYALVVDKDELAADIVLKLSDLMRYSLYETGNNRILLCKEVKFIEDYIKLEQVRHKEHVQIDIQFDDFPTNLEIHPLILITFVENAFKHGINNTIDASYVRFTAYMEEGEFVFIVRNSKPSRLQKETVAGGIGLVNVRRRLDLLYHEHYTLHIENTPNYYLVELKLTLYENQAELHHRGRRTTLSKLD